MFKIENKKTGFFLLLLFLLSLGIRFLIAPLPGHIPDFRCWQEWSRSINKFGIINVYEKRVEPTSILPDYLPSYLYILGFLGLIYQKFFSPTFELNTPTLIFLLKLPAIIFDLLTGFFIFWLLRNQFKLKFWLAFLILGFYLFNPGLIYNSSYWGQIDSIHTFFILVALFFATKNKFSFSWIFLTIALFFKLQSIIFFPLLFFLNFQKESLKKLIKNFGLSILTAFVICSPFILSGKIFQVIRIPFILTESYPYLSVNAFNFWWLFALRPYPFGLSDKDNFLGLAPYFLIGFALFFFVYFLLIKNILKNNSPKIIYLIAAFIALSFFMLPTRIHERYLYSFFPIFILILNKEKRFWLIYLLLSFTYFANLAAVTPFWKSEYLFNFSPFSSWPIVFINIFCFFYLLYYLFYAGKKNSYRLTNL